MKTEKIKILDSLFKKYGIRVKKDEGKFYSSTETEIITEIVSDVFDFFQIPFAFFEKRRLTILFKFARDRQDFTKYGWRNRDEYDIRKYCFAYDFKPCYSHGRIKADIHIYDDFGIEHAKLELTYGLARYFDDIFFSGEHKKTVRGNEKIASLESGTAENILARVYEPNPRLFYLSYHNSENFAKAITMYFDIEALNNEKYFLKSDWYDKEKYETLICPFIKLFFNWLNGTLEEISRIPKEKEASSFSFPFVSSNFLLSDFDKTECELQEYPDIAFFNLNNEIFSFLENLPKEALEKDCELYAENLYKYVSFLKTNTLYAKARYEFSAHFVFLFIESKYQNANNFIYNNCGNVFREILDFSYMF